MRSELLGLGDASPDAMICADADGCITYWNRAAASMFGIAPEAALGASLDLIVPEQMRGAHVAGMKRLAQGGEPRIVGRVVEVIAQHVDGRIFPIEMSLARWERDGQLFFGSVIRDVSERRRSQDRLHHLAHFDQLTLLPNRTLFIERLEGTLAGADAATVLLVDLDRFKEVNDHLGHQAGDAVLCEAARRLKQCVSAADATVARIGGDEFAIIMPKSADLFAASYTADTILDAFDNAFIFDERECKVGCSIGIAFAPNDGTTTAELLGNADLALYKAKHAGGRLELFTPSLRARSATRRHVEKELERAVEQHELELFYQPQVRLRDKAIIGAEALMRWRHPEKGLLAPASFISVLESMRLADAVGKWVLKQACMQAAAWQDLLPGFRMGVNLFEAQVHSPSLASDVQHALALFGLPASCLELEITENTVIDKDDGCVASLRRLRDCGISLAFDDYGTGFASLSLLKRFPLSRLKIDRSFVRDIAVDAEDQAIVAAVVSLGRQFNLGTIAEGIETPEQELLLQACGCQEAQGYRYGKPMDAAAMTHFFSAGIPQAVHLAAP